MGPDVEFHDLLFDVREHDLLAARRPNGTLSSVSGRWTAGSRGVLGNLALSWVTLKLLTNLFQGMVGVHADPEPHAQDTFFTRRQEDSTRVVASRRLAWIAASSGMTAFGSWMKSPR